MERTLIAEAPKHIGRKIKISGWVNAKRNHGHLIFIDVRDRSGIMQSVVIPDNGPAYDAARMADVEFMMEAEGIVRECPMCARDAESQMVSVELDVLKMVLLSKVRPTPRMERIGIAASRQTAHHQYLDLCAEKMQTKLHTSDGDMRVVKSYLGMKGFFDLTAKNSGNRKTKSIPVNPPKKIRKII